MALTIDLVPHLEAGDRNAWQGDQDERALSELGRQQAIALADALGAEPVDALYAGPALRCRQSLEVLAERLGLPVNVLPELGEKQAWRAPEGWDAKTSLWPPEALSPAVSSAFAAGSLALAVNMMRISNLDGRFVACSHGHTIPAFAAYHVGAGRAANLPALEYRGQWYRVRLGEGTLAIERVEAAGFPR